MPMQAELNLMIEIREKAIELNIKNNGIGFNPR